MFLSLYWPSGCCSRADTRAAPIFTSKVAKPARIWLTAASFGCALALGGGCPQGTAKVSSLSALELAASPEPRAEADFRAAMVARKAGRLDEAEQRLKGFMDAWPKDPLVPYAKLELGRIELDRNDYRAAQEWLDDVAKQQNPALAEHARMYGAVASQRLGQHEHAIAVLRPMLGRTVDPEDTTLVLDTLGAAEQAIGDEPAALATRDKELSGDLPEVKRNEVEELVRKLVAGLDPVLKLPLAYEKLPRSGVAWPLVAKRLLRVSHERGDRERVSKVAQDLADEGIALDEELAALVSRAERSSEADPGVIGAILPLSGRGREVGEAALQGLLLASETQPTGRTPPRLVYRDDGGDAAKAVDALEDLVSVHRAIAVIGPLSNGPAQAVAGRAEELGIPVLALNPDPALNERSRDVYRLLPEPREEATLLVRQATRAGARRLVLLHPDNSYGQAMLRAFESALEDANASLQAISYSPTTTNFVQAAEQAARLQAEALILADSPARVALIAPALAAAGLWSVPPGEKPSAGHAVTLLVPSAGFDPTLARTSRRYLQGAFFAVPFDGSDTNPFAVAYRARFQSAPNLFAAAAHDAYRILEAALSSNVTNRGELIRALSTAKATGTATAVDSFSASHAPRAPLRIEMLLGEAFVRSD
jgi:branched-chain amino acid transport system substrate-binding protein